MNQEKAFDALTRIEEELKESIKVTDLRIAEKVIALQERIERFVTAIVPQNAPRLETDTPDSQSIRNAYISLYRPFREFELSIRSCRDTIFKTASFSFSLIRGSIELWSALELPKEKTEKIVSDAISSAEEFRNDTEKCWSDLVDEEFKQMSVDLEKLIHAFAAQEENAIKDILGDHEN